MGSDTPSALTRRSTVWSACATAWVRSVWAMFGFSSNV